MDNSVNPEKLKKAPIASSCFMGLGQILYLKQYVRGALFALVQKKLFLLTTMNTIISKVHLIPTK